MNAASKPKLFLLSGRSPPKREPMNGVSVTSARAGDAAQRSTNIVVTSTLDFFVIDTPSSVAIEPRPVAGSGEIGILGAGFPNLAGLCVAPCLVAGASAVLAPDLFLPLPRCVLGPLVL